MHGFDKLYYMSTGEQALFALFVIAVSALLGYLAESMLKARGFGILGNGAIILAGCVAGVAAHDWVARQAAAAGFHMMGDVAMVVVFEAAFATFLLLLTTSIKKIFA